MTDQETRLRGMIDELAYRLAGTDDRLERASLEYAIVCLERGVLALGQADERKERHGQQICASREGSV